VASDLFHPDSPNDDNLIDTIDNALGQLWSEYRGIKGVCYRNGGMLSCGVFLVYLVVHSLEYSIFLRGKRYLGIFSECILFGP
jgi:hypothetical protein